jgi:ubiquitin thioesterase protein OTUB1
VKKEDILTTHFADAAHSDYLIVFLRLLTSAELRNNAEFYQNFLTEGQTVQEFTQFEVEPMYKESDHIQIVALAAVFNIGVTVVYLDRGDGIQTHPFQEEAQGKRITMLYRPGHYDLIY